MTRKLNRLLTRLMKPMGDDGGDAGGGTGPSGGDAIGTGNDARVAMLNAIGDRHDEFRAEELADIRDDGSTEEFVVQRADGEQEDLTEDPPIVEPETPPRVDEPAPLDTAQMITRKVNGKLVTKPLEEWLVDASKVNAADEYLQDAARLRKEVVREPAPQEPQQPVLTPEQLAAERREKLRQRVRAIQMGTEDEAISAFEEMENAVSRPTITADDINRVTDERLKFNTAISEFRKEFSDLVSNPQLNRMVLDMDAALIARGDKRSYSERYTEVGQAVRQWRDDLIKSSTPEPTVPAAEKNVTSLDTRRAAKAAAPKVPQAASKSSTPPPEDDGEEDVSSVIAGIAKARGGPQWARG
jgi:hypothetical protein